MGAEFVIRIKVDPTGANQAGAAMERSLGRAQSKAMELNKTLRHVFGVYAIKEVLTGLVTLSDGYTTLQNRLRSVTTDQANLNGVTSESYKIAQATRSGWEATAMMYARMSRNSKELGYSQREMLDFTKSLNQAVIVGGATAQEASAGLVQLSQGLASGALRGDELRSVLEQLPVVADVIAKHLGVTRGQLRQLGTDGKITARDVVEAFKKAAPELEREFGKTIPTLAQSWTMLGNAAVKFFGEIGTGSGALSGLSSLLQTIADNFDTIGKIVVSVGQFIGVYLAVYAIGKLIMMLKMLGAAALSNPFTAILYAVTALVIVLRQFGDELDSGVSGSLVKVSDVLNVLWEDIKKVGSAIMDFLGEAWNALVGAFSDGLDGAGVELSLRNALLMVASFVDAAISLFRALKDTILLVFGAVPVAIADLFVKLAQSIMSVLTTLANKVIGVVNYLVNSTKTLAGISGAALQGRKYVPQKAEDIIGKVDWNINNPFEGAPEHFQNRMGDIWGKDFESSTARDYVGDVFDRATKNAGPDASKRESIGTSRGQFLPPPPTAADLAKWKKLWNELQSVMGGSSAITKAEMDLAKAVDVTTRAVAAGMIGVEEASKIVADWTAKTEDARHPLQAWIRDIQAEGQSLRLSNLERERASKLLEAENDLKEKGVAVTDMVRGQLAKEIQNLQFRQAAQKAANDEQEALQSAYSRINKPIWDYNRGLETANHLMRDGTISSEQYLEEVRSLDQAYGEFARTLDKDFAQVADTIGNAFDTISDALLDFVISGKGSLQDLVQDLEKMVLKLLLFQAVKAGLGSTGGGSAGAMISNALFGFADGGSFMVGGQGGTDSQIVAFRASPNERVTVTRPDQAPPGTARSGAAPVVHNHIHMDRKELLSGLNSREGQETVANVSMRQVGAALSLRRRNY